MYVILGIIKVKAAHLQEFVHHVRQHARHSEQEPGCVRFEVLQDVDDPQTICLYEAFRGERDLETHRAQEYYKRWMSMSRDWRDTSVYTRRVLRPLDPPDEPAAFRS